MYDFFKDHAYRNVWCTPDQDKQFILELAKLTPFNGARSNISVAWKKHWLPDQSNQWHVYQIGQVHPLIIGLFPKCNQWVSLAETSNRQKMICDIYTSSGVQIPRVETYYIHTDDRNIIVAVKKNKKLPYDFNKESLFLRLYTNEYFNTQRAHNTNDYIFVEGGLFTDSQDILDLQTSYEDHLTKTGQTYAFVNGKLVHAIDDTTFLPGDVGEFVYDSSIEKVIDFKLNQLNAFTSTLDDKSKFVLHYGGEGTTPTDYDTDFEINSDYNLTDPQILNTDFVIHPAGSEVGRIDFTDDIDVFVIHKNEPGKHIGLFYHQNKQDAFRNLTHRDYSVVGSYITSFVNKIKSFYSSSNMVDLEDVIIRLHVRKSGYNRNLTFDANRIHELYKLKDVEILRAMLGIDSNVSYWKAAVLEAAGYSEIMRSAPESVDNVMVERAYGYNALSKIAADTPKQSYDFSSINVVDVPYIHQRGCTCYEYDATGKMVAWNFHSSGVRYTCTDPTTTQVEMIAGKGGNSLSEIYDFRSIGFVKEIEFRVYECVRSIGTVDNNFIDVTGNPAKYEVVNDRINWIETNPFKYPMIRFNTDFLALDIDLNMSDGQLKITLNHQQRRNNTWLNYVMNVPMGELDVFMNGKSLIRDLDYVYKFPNIYIINKSHLVNPITQAQKIHVRFTGFCKPDFSLNEFKDDGFIEHGVLSNNNRFDIRDDKVLRITVDGLLKTREDFVFSEHHSGVSMLDPLNGKPYQVKDIIVPLRGLATSDTYALRDISIVTDKVVSDYLSMKIPQPNRPALNAIPNRYEVFSPFSNKLIYDLASGKLVLEEKIYKINEVMAVCKKYEYLLAFDPTQEEQRVNSSYVIIHPHSLDTTINLDLNEFRFLAAAITLYLKDAVTLSPFVQITP